MMTVLIIGIIYLALGLAFTAFCEYIKCFDEMLDKLAAAFEGDDIKFGGAARKVYKILSWLEYVIFWWVLILVAIMIIINNEKS